MPTDPLKLQALTAQAITQAVALLPDVRAWERGMRQALVTGQTAAYLSGLSERLGVPLGSKLLNERNLSKQERAEIKQAVEAQLQYLKGFQSAIPNMSEAQVAARAMLYSGSVKSTYYAARWGEWDIPQGLLPGQQACLGNCGCTVSVRDNGDGTGMLTRVLGGAEHHCTECPPLAGEHPVKRRAA